MWVRRYQWAGTTILDRLGLPLLTVGLRVNTTLAGIRVGDQGSARQTYLLALVRFLSIVLHG